MTKPTFHIAAMAVLGLLLSLAGGTLAGDLPAPVIPKGKGKTCVADTEIMRRSHMQVLDHQRDETVRQGIRGGKFSLRECVECHAVPGPGGAAVTAADPKHFCTACHQFAAVKIDCFECHASRPAPKARASKAQDGAVVELFRTEPR